MRDEYVFLQRVTGDTLTPEAFRTGLPIVLGNYCRRKRLRSVGFSTETTTCTCRLQTVNVNFNMNPGMALFSEVSH